MYNGGGGEVWKRVVEEVVSAGISAIVSKLRQVAAFQIWVSVLVSSPIGHSLRPS